MTKSTWQEELVRRHSRLFVCSLRGHGFSPAYPLCPDGWCQVVTTLVVRVSETTKGYPVQFCEISERFGRLRIYWKSESTLPNRIERDIADAVALAEARSACTCTICGTVGHPFFSPGGRLRPLCSEHAEGEPMLPCPGATDVHLVRVTTQNKIETIKCRRYDRQLDAFVDLDTTTCAKPKAPG